MRPHQDAGGEVLLKALDKPPKKPRGRPKAKFQLLQAVRFFCAPPLSDL